MCQGEIGGFLLVLAWFDISSLSVKTALEQGFWGAGRTYTRWDHSAPAPWLRRLEGLNLFKEGTSSLYPFLFLTSETELVHCVQFPAAFPGCLHSSCPREDALGGGGDCSAACLMCPSKSPPLPAVRGMDARLRGPEVTSLVIAALWVPAAGSQNLEKKPLHTLSSSSLSHRRSSEAPEMEETRITERL